MKSRTINLLYRLLHSKIPLTIKYLATEFEVSERTIRNDISEINELLNEKNLKPVTFKRSKGVILNLTDDEQQRLFEENIEERYLNREERIRDLILDIAFGNDPVFLNKKEILYQVSKSTIDEDMRQVRKLFNKFQVEVVSTPKLGLQLQGKEQYLRTMLFSLLNYEISKTNFEEIFEKHVSKDIWNTLDLIYSQCISEKEDSHYRTNFNLLTLIWLQRLSQGNTLPSSKISINETLTKNYILNYINLVLQEFSFSVSKTEKRYLYFLLSTLDNNIDFHPTNWLDIQLMILKLIEFVGSETGIPFDKKETQLQQALYSHISSMVIRINQNLQLINPLKEKIKQSYGIVYSAIEKFMNSPEFNFVNSITDDEIAFLTIHFSTALSELNQESTYWFRAIVICNHGIATGKLLAENLKEFFNIEVLAVLSSREVGLIEKFDADLIFSTIEIHYNLKPVMVIDSIFNEETKLLVSNFLEGHREYRRIGPIQKDYTEMFQKILSVIELENGSVSKTLYNSIEELFQNNDLIINERDIKPMLQDLLEDKYIIFEKDETEWQNAIIKSAKPLLDNEIINQDYIGAMIESVKEYGPYIVIGKHLALAHARPEDGALKLGLSLCLFDKPVIFNHEFNDPVKIIFCLSAIDSYSHLNVMKAIVNLIKEDNNLNKLLEAKDIETVKKILYKIEEEN